MRSSRLPLALLAGLAWPATTLAQVASPPPAPVPSPVLDSLEAALLPRPLLLLPNAAAATTGSRLLLHSPPIGITTDTTFTPFLNVQTALSLAPGVQVTPTSGVPGAWATVRIRGGAGNEQSDQPLYVVDGMPALNSDYTGTWPLESVPSPFSSPRLPVGSTNPLLLLPLEDVASVTVLQGALATARYGAQGANGVVLITTRRGGEGGRRQPLRVRYAGTGGVQRARQTYDLLNATQYMALANEASLSASNGTMPIPFGPNALGNAGPDTDWQGELLRTAAFQEHHLSLDGSGPRTRYLASADYLNQDGVVLNANQRRYTLRLNADQQIGKKLVLALTATAAHHTQTLPDATALPAALLAPPNVPARNPDGSLYQTNRLYAYPSFNRTFYNPLALATEAGSEGTTRRLLASLRATYHLTPHLTLAAGYSQEEMRYAGTVRELETVLQSSAPPTPTKLTEQEQQATAGIGHLGLTYHRAWADAHALSLALDAEEQRYERRIEEVRFETNYFAGSERYGSTTYRRYARLTADYRFQRRYEILTTVRVDDVLAASGFANEAPVAVSPGAEVRWHLHEESWLPASQVLTAATLWAGIGQSSNSNRPGSDYTTSSAFDITTYTSIFNPSQRVPAGRTTQVETGLRLGFWKQVLLLDLTAYRRHTPDLPVRQMIGLPTATQYTSLLLIRDVALRHQGLQLAAQANWQLGPVRGATRVGAALQQSRVTAIKDEAGTRLPPGLRVGEAPHPYFLVQRLAVSPLGTVNSAGEDRSGRIRYVDVDRDGYISQNDGQYRGNGVPTQLFTLTQDLRLGRTSLNLQLDALGGHQLLNTTLAQLHSPTGNTNNTTELLGRWTPTQYNVEFPQARANSVPPYYTDYTPQYADHLRLSQLTLTYDVLTTPRRPQFSVWAGGQNLFVITKYQGYDPNVSSGGASTRFSGYDTNTFPVARIWQLGVRGSF